VNDDAQIITNHVSAPQTLTYATLIRFAGLTLCIFPNVVKGETSMNQPKLITHASLSFCLILLSSLISVAQADDRRSAMQVKPSYDIVLHLVVGSNDSASARDELPAALANVAKQLKTNFTLSNYRLGNTFLARVSNGGSFEYKSVGDVFGKDAGGAQQSFVEWAIGRLEAMPTGKGHPGFQTQSFRFGVRIPVQTTIFQSESGKGSAVYNYEGIGLSIREVGFEENKPTLVGTLNLPGANGTIFLIMTVRTTD
jgi:hypothetical protein